MDTYFGLNYFIGKQTRQSLFEFNFGNCVKKAERRKNFNLFQVYETRVRFETLTSFTYRIHANTTPAAYKKMRVLWWDFTK